MKFTKMHGIGNDYVYVDGFAERVADPAAVARQVSDRHFGIGSDGLILILPSERADVRMRMFNADGSEGEMCGNGIRCVAKYAYDHGLSKQNPMRVETGRGVLTLALDLQADKVERVTVDMDEPILDLPEIPVDPDKVAPTERPHEYRFAPKDSTEELTGVFVSMGNPHVVFFVPDADGVDLARLGPFIETDPLFPERVNVNVASVEDGALRLRVWERGAGETQACGTGACAAAAAAFVWGRVGREVTVHQPGGNATVRLEDNTIVLSGPAEHVATVEVPWL